MTDSPKDRAYSTSIGARVHDDACAVFAEPWEARAFALAVALSRGGQFAWDEFRDRLVAEIAQADAAGLRERDTIAAAPRSPYYECWLAALEKLLREKALLNAGEIEGRAAAIAAAPPAPTKAQSRGPIRI